MLSFSNGKKKKWPCELMTKLISLNGEPGRVEIKTCAWIWLWPEKYRIL